MTGNYAEKWELGLETTKTGFDQQPVKVSKALFMQQLLMFTKRFTKDKYVHKYSHIQIAS